MASFTRFFSKFQETIDTYDFQTGTESLNVAQLPAPMAHMGCINGIKGKDGNPTVAICKSKQILIVMNLMNTT